MPMSHFNAMCIIDEGLIFLTKTATLWSDCVNDLPSVSINVDLPAPGAPEKLILRERAEGCYREFCVFSDLKVSFNLFDCFNLFR